MDPSWTINSCWISRRAQAWRRDNIAAHIQAAPAIGHGSHPGQMRLVSASNNLQSTSDGMPAALVLQRMAQDLPTEITDVACRISGRWEHRDHATGRPL